MTGAIITSSMLNLTTMNIFKLWCFSLLMLATVGANAAVVSNLYNAQIPVATQTPADRATALQMAYSSVLIKVTGDSKVMQNNQIKKNAANVEQYIQQYSYQTNTDSTSNTYPYQLMVQFDPEAINRTLITAKLPIWGQDRPLTIFWIATTINGEQRLLSASDTGPISNTLDKAAQVYALPILFPILDLNDLNQLSVTDIVGRFIAPVVQASVRYGSNAIVMINIEQQNKQWTSLWTLVTANAPQSWQVQGANIDQVVTDGMARLVGMLSQQFALKGISQQAMVNLQIQGISTLNDYAHATRYLQRLSVVKKVTLIELTAHQATFQLMLAGTSTELQKAIALDPTLTGATPPAAATLNINGELPVPLTSPPATTIATNAPQTNLPEVLIYQWTP